MNRVFSIGHWSGAALAMMVAAAPAWALDKSFDIPAQSATTGIAALGHQAGIQILAARRDTSGKRTNAVAGKMSIEQALARLLAGTGLTAQMTGAQTYSVVPIGAAVPEGGREALSAVGEPAAGSEVVVTGTNIRGAEVTSPVHTYSHAQIEATGAVTMEQFARNLPQNFNVANRESAALGTEGSDTDAFGTGFNLHGLGTGSTLTLINGRRVAPGGSAGAFVDVSIIPLVAVDHVDVLTDGSSAIYGADAVAGVVNIVLRDHYDGAETSVYGNIPTRGGGRETGASQIVGKAWSTGNVMLAGDYYDARPIFGSQRDFIPPSTFPLPYAISPSFKRQSLLGDVEQHIGPVLTLFLQGSWNHQRFAVDQSLLSFATNRIAGVENSYSGTGGVDLALSDRWSVELSGSYAKTWRHDNDVYAGMLSFFSSSGATGTALTEGEARVNGALIDLPGGTVRTAFGYEARHESFHSHYSGVSFADEFTASSRDVDGLFGELSIPLVGQDNASPGLRRLLLSGAVRYDHYSDVGGALSPKAGALWAPIDGVDLRATWGRSFRAPLLSQLDPAGLSYDLEAIPTPSGDTINTLYSVGSNPSLKPERSTAISAGIDIKPRAIKGLQFSTSYFSIDYRNRIAAPPVLGGVYNIYVDPEGLSRFLSLPADPALVAAAYATGKVESSTGLTRDDVQAYFSDNLNNIARMKTSGLEFSLNYSFERPIGTITAGIEGNWIFTLKQQPTAGEAYVKLDNTEFQPADFRANATLGWSKGRAGVTGMLHYVGSYRDTLTTPESRVRAWATGDIAINYDFGSEGRHGLLSGFRASIVVQNVLDSAPPRLAVDPDRGIPDNGYDPSNASAVGRAISLRLTKTW